MDSQIRQKHQSDCKAAINRMVNMKLYASYIYLPMSSYFDRSDVALRHVAEFFWLQSCEEWEPADKLRQFQSQGGGHVLLHDIKKPECDVWGTALEAMEAALQLEKHMVEVTEQVGLRWAAHFSGRKVPMLGVCVLGKAYG
ncbi:ferritin heavy chain A-like [Heteronotia binoei]|uniref:ferritin heavy chain A-like n=1 Tax=Heteronotia binoei TaxID=13085 RepID=UPI0029315B1D|nr:ferritin heavy chain A-like [Heteronotia binoei]